MYTYILIVITIYFNIIYCIQSLIYILVYVFSNLWNMKYEHKLNSTQFKYSKDFHNGDDG